MKTVTTMNSSQTDANTYVFHQPDISEIYATNIPTEHLEFNRNWHHLFNLIMTRSVFIEGKFMTLEEKLSTISCDELVTHYPHLVYTSLKCEYADFLIDMHNFFLECINAFASIEQTNDSENQIIDYINLTLNYLIFMKPFIVKIMYNLFYLMDHIPILRTTEQSLLKSLAAINLFLYYNEIEKPYVIYFEQDSDNVDFKKTTYAVSVLQKSLAQIISMVERFRYQYCEVSDPYNYRNDTRQPLTDYSDVENLIKNWLLLTMDRLKPLIELDEIISYEEFNIEMYNPQFVLLDSLMEYNNDLFKSVKTKWYDRTMLLENVYNKIKTSYDFQNILDFQNTLFGVIADIFYIKLRYLLRWNDKSKLLEFLDDFNVFVNEIIPSNCATNVRFVIVTVKNNFESALNEFVNNNDTSHLLSLKNELDSETKDNSVKWKKSSKSIILQGLSLSELVKSIVEHRQFKSFSAFAKLLSYESNTNNDYYVLKVYDQNAIKTANAEIEIQTRCTRMKQFRYNLFLFNFVMSCCDFQETQLGFNTPFLNQLERASTSAATFSIKTDACCFPFNVLNREGYIDNYVDSSFEDMTVYIIGLHQMTEDDQIFQDVLLPILIYFYNVKRNFKQTENMHDELNKLKHIVLMAINTIEYHEMNICEWPYNNRNMFYNLVKDYGIDITVSGYFNEVLNKLVYDQEQCYLKKMQSELKTAANNSKIILKEKYLETFYEQYIHEIFLGNYDTDIELYFCWNGEVKLVYDVLQDVLGNINDKQQFTKFQFFKIKWFVVKLLAKLLYVLDYFKNLNKIKSNDIILKQQIKSALENFIENLSLDAIKILIYNTISSFINMFDRNSQIDIFKFTYSYSLVLETFKSFGVYINSKQKYNISNIFLLINNHLEYFKEYLNNIQNDPNTLVFNVNFSNFLYPFSTKVT